MTWLPEIVAHVALLEVGVPPRTKKGVRLIVVIWLAGIEIDVAVGEDTEAELVAGVVMPAAELEGDTTVTSKMKV